MLGIWAFLGANSMDRDGLRPLDAKSAEPNPRKVAAATVSKTGLGSGLAKRRRWVLRLLAR